MDCLLILILTLILTLISILILNYSVSGHVAVGLFAKADKEDNDLYGRDPSSNLLIFVHKLFLETYWILASISILIFISLQYADAALCYFKLWLQLISKDDLQVVSHCHVSWDTLHHVSWDTLHHVSWDTLHHDYVFPDKLLINESAEFRFPFTQYSFVMFLIVNCFWKIFY